MSSTDVFPVEFLDIKDNRLVLYGRDIFKEIKVGKKNLRLEIEREFKSALLRVMRAYMLTGGHHGKIKNLMRDSLSTFTTLFRATLRLYGKKVPVTKKSIIEQCAITLKLNSGLLFDILMLKEGRDTIEKNADEYFTRYIAELDKASEKIDKF